MSPTTTRTLTCAEARAWLLGATGLWGSVQPASGAAARALLSSLRCIQLDPLDRIGTNADLVAMARLDGLRRGELLAHLFPGHAFEHFAKERCLLPAGAFPHYRDQAAETPWWRLGERLKRLPPSLIEEVLAEVRERGPITPSALAHRGRVEALDWAGWKGTGRASTMALEVLWTRCQIVVCGRKGREKSYDLPERALPEQAAARVSEPFARWALRERVEAAGLLCTAGGPQWSMLAEARTSPLPARLVAEGASIEVRVEGSRRSYLAPPDLGARAFSEGDDRLRILGPLDPLLWDRKLVAQVFGFDYVWEVYKPAAQRRWGYYVCPLLHRGRLVGRLEAHREGRRLVVDRLWEEAGQELDRRALDEALSRHEAGM
ncbi:MAG: crosslink repair DNA glycosylase YcaQ family protein [Pseudomonadota bacterium]